MSKQVQMHTCGLPDDTGIQHFCQGFCQVFCHDDVRLDGCSSLEDTESFMCCCKNALFCAAYDSRLPASRSMPIVRLEGPSDACAQKACTVCFHANIEIASDGGLR